MYYGSFHNADLSELKCKNLKFVAPRIILGTVNCCKQMFGARCLIWCITPAKVYYIRVQEPGRNGNGKDRRSSFKISKLKSHQQQVKKLSASRRMWDLGSGRSGARDSGQQLYSLSTQLHWFEPNLQIEI
jgi:hypothetical protein